MNKNWDKKVLPISGHLEELRKRIIICVLAWLIVSLIIFNYVKYVYTYIKYSHFIYYLYLSPVDFIKVGINTSMMLGLFVSLPLIVFNIWKFVKPAISIEHRKIWIFSIFFGLFMFFLGAVFAVLVVVPSMLNFFIEFSESKYLLNFEITKYLSFITSITLLFGFIFEVPLMMFILAKFRILKKEYIDKFRKYIILLIFIFSAVVTPPDVISQFFMAIPLLILMEIGTILVKIVEKIRRKNV